MWSIACTVNNVDISDKCAEELFEAQDYEGEIWDDLEYVTDDDGNLYFNPDFNESMDYISNDSVIDVLKKHKVKGDICFGSLEGDNAGSFWGYRFDGLGGMAYLKGKLVWSEKTEKLKGKTFVITGKLESMTRDEVEALIEDDGGTVARSVSKKTNFLVVGEKPGSKYEKANRLGITVINEAVLLKMLE